MAIVKASLLILRAGNELEPCLLWDALPVHSESPHIESLRTEHLQVLESCWGGLGSFPTPSIPPKETNNKTCPKTPSTPPTSCGPCRWQRASQETEDAHEAALAKAYDSVECVKAGRGVGCPREGVWLRYLTAIGLDLYIDFNFLGNKGVFTT